MSHESPTAEKKALGRRILIGFLFGIVAGCVVLAVGRFYPPVLETARKAAAWGLDPFGQVFLRLLFMVVVPLVFCSLAQGIVQLGNLRKLGPLAGRTGSLFLLNMGVGVILALIGMNLVEPGNHLSPETRTLLLSQFSKQATHAAEANLAGGAFSPAALVRMFFPPNLLKAVTDFEVMPLILFALLVGAAGANLPPEKHRLLEKGLDIGMELMTSIVGFAMRLAPYAVPAMIFSILVKAGLDILKALALFACLVLGILALHLFGSMTVFLKVLTKRRPKEFFLAIRDVLFTAFGTSSSNATLPAALKVAREDLGVSPSTAGFVLPLGTTMNMSGTALYEGSVVLFIAQVYGVHLSLGQQAHLLVLSVLSAVAVAGIPGGSLPMIAGLLMAFGVPPEGLAIIFGVDRLLDMARTTCNVGCDIATACIVDEAETA
jgi:DAACS family dicarboxylate/amino acid:cation (Na+ or H+) symporter